MASHEVGGGAIKGRVDAALESFVQMDRQATQPAAVPSGRKRRRVSSKKPKEEAPALDLKATRDLEMTQIGLSRPEAEALEKKVLQDPSSELSVALKALSRAELLEKKATQPPTPSPTDQSVNELMKGTLKDYEEECVEEGTFHSDPATEVGEWEVLDEMDTQFNQLLYETCPFHPHQFITCVNPQASFGPLRFKCPQPGCPVYLFEDTREVMMEKLKEDTHPQVHARLKHGELKCKCGLVPKMKLSRTAKNHNKVFFSCGSFVPGGEPCGYFQWLHGPLWYPREQAQPTLRRWVKDTPPELHYMLQHKKECIPLLKGPEKERPWGMHQVERYHKEKPNPMIEKIKYDPWMKQFGESVQAQENAFERRRHLHKNFGSSCLF